jgi:PAS domain S-box-containing protein
VTNVIDESIWGEAVQNAAVAAFLSREEGVVTVNRAVTELTGYTFEEILGDDVPPLGVDPEESKRLETEVRSGARATGNTRIRHKNGAIVRISFLVARTIVGRDTMMFGLLWADA